MERRTFIGRLAGGLLGAPLAARAQPSAMPVIGYISPQAPDTWASRLQAFRQGLSETGYIEGRNVAIEYRWAEGKADRFSTFAAELVSRKVAVISAPGSTPAVIAAKAATTTIPIIFVTAVDPVAGGLVASLNQPGGNLTGVAALSAELGPKQLELLHEFVPTATIIGLLVNPTSPLIETQTRNLLATARRLGLQLDVVHAGTERDFDKEFATLVQLRAGGLVISGEQLFTSGSKQLAALALSHSLPAIYQFREFAAAGGLMSYGSSLLDGHRLAGVYTGRALSGEKPPTCRFSSPPRSSWS